MRLHSRWRSRHAVGSAGSSSRRAGLAAVRVLPRTGLAAVLVHCTVALVLVLAQREASLHWLSHATEAATAKHSVLASSDVCQECLSLSGLDSVAHPEPLVMAALHVPQVIEPASTWVSAASLLQLGYASRGPPAIC